MLAPAGSALYFHRNDNLGPRNFFDAQGKPEFRRHQAGGSLGGPLRRDRTFFFGSYEALREVRGVNVTNTTLSEEAGAGAFSGWAMAECGPLAGGCADPSACDEVHLFLGKIAVIQRPKLLPDGQSRLDALYLTTLLPAAPKIILNLDTGEYGVLARRDCGCGLQREGLTVHRHTIRSYEKLTTGGMHFLGGEFVSLVEEVLPMAFGGSPADYQFVEEERGPESKVRILISPRVGPVEEPEVAGKVLSYLASRSRGHHSMAWHWQQS